MNDRMQGVFARISQVKLDNFRGFKGSHSLDTDADLVLISGPNGHGKSSLLEALALSLTGWHPHRSDEDLISREPAKPSETQEDEPKKEEPIDRAAVYVRGRTEQRTDCGIEADIPRDDAIGFSETGLERNEDSYALDDPELLARLCAFFQDRLEYLFDEATSGRTFRDVFEKVPDEVTDLLTWIKALKESLQLQVTQFEETNARVETGRETGNSALMEAWSGVAPLLRQMIETLGANWPSGAPPSPDRIANAAEMDTFARALVDALLVRRAPQDPTGLREAFSDALREVLAREIERARKAASEASDRTADLHAEKTRIERDIAGIEARYPNLDDDVRRFEAGDPDLPNALDVFRALARNADAWAQAPDDPDNRLRRVCAEFGMVDRTAAGVCAEDLALWLEPLQKAWSDHQEMTKKLRDIERDLKGSLESERVRIMEGIRDDLKKPLQSLDVAWRGRHEFGELEALTEGRNKAIAYLNPNIKGIEGCENELEEITTITKELLEDLSPRVHDVLWRFDLVDGVLPLVLAPDLRKVKGSDGVERQRLVYVIHTKDGRRLQDLSTGQKAQVGVSLLVAQNLAATHLLNHRIILLDDVTTAYDLSNLTREAILWRQFAYGAVDGSDQKRQIFISSHHEEMTNHLLNLLVPPPGRSMRLIRFTGWSNEHGPEIETFKVEPSEKVSNETLKATLAAL